MIHEVRFIRTELRAKKGATPGLEGYAAKYNSDSLDLGGFIERINPGTFARAIRENQDVRCVFNHNADKVLGRTKSGTLRLKEDTTGLFFDVDYPDTNDARDLATLVGRGDVDQCSFKFSVEKQNWTEEPDPADPTGKAKRYVRVLEDVDLYDVGPVTFPAYPDTAVNVRSLLWPTGIPKEVQEHLKERRKRAVAGIELAAENFAYVGDRNDPRTWSLPILVPGNAEETRKAIDSTVAAFAAIRLPLEGKVSAWRMIRSAAKKAGVAIGVEERNKALRALDSNCECNCTRCQDDDCANCSADDPSEYHGDDSERSTHKSNLITGDELERMRHRMRFEALL